MNERIKELVTATDAWCDQNFPPDWTDRVDEFLPLWNEKFAALVAAAEREACAKVAELVAREMDDTNGTATYIAKAIRARGSK
jgi:hypothetical protein